MARAIVRTPQEPPPSAPPFLGSPPPPSQSPPPVSVRPEAQPSSSPAVGCRRLCPCGSACVPRLRPLAASPAAAFPWCRRRRRARPRARPPLGPPSAHGAAPPPPAAGWSRAAPSSHSCASMMVVPLEARKVPRELVEDGDVRTDNYYWLCDDPRSNPNVVAHLHAENDYTMRIFNSDGNGPGMCGCDAIVSGKVKSLELRS